MAPETSSASSSRGFSWQARALCDFAEGRPPRPGADSHWTGAGLAICLVWCRNDPMPAPDAGGRSFVERVLALPAWAWFAAACMSHALGSETWYWMMAMPFVSLIRSIYERQLAEHAAAPTASAASKTDSGTAPSAPNTNVKSERGVPRKKTA